ncbi:hypothetical protein [Nocardia sp. NPDC049707]|uniref:hypothetical protein n=1 Tax=Nocardia sp. NPDC049707 TaxID=3154735 RepID=UPI003428B147
MGRLRDWWYYFHQRGVFMHCTGMFVPCFADNVAHWMLRRETTWADWPYRWHHKAGERVGIRYAENEQQRAEWLTEFAETTAHMDAIVARARRIHELGWGS